MGTQAPQKQSVREKVDDWTGTLARVASVLGMFYEIAIDSMQNPQVFIAAVGIFGLPTVIKTQRERNKERERNGL